MSFRLLGCVLAFNTVFLALQSSAAVAQAIKPGAAAKTPFVLWYRNYDNPATHALVTLALEKTPEYGDFNLVKSPEMSQGRVVRELSKATSDLVSIANVASNTERERELLAIPIPVDGGLLGLRVCLVRKDDLPRFKGISSLKDFVRRGIRIGQGTHWPDSTVLQIHGVPVVTHSRYEALFSMLENKRFECFARSVGEVLYELRLKAPSNYVIEPDLLIAYAMPSYFFVSRANHAVAQRLQLGMERAIQDGSFSDYLTRYYAQPIDQLNLGSRTVLVLDNPFLSGDSQDIGRNTLRELRRRIRQTLPVTTKP